MSDRPYLDASWEDVQKLRTPERPDCSDAAIERMSSNMVSGWGEHPHSAMELLVSLAESLPLVAANRVVHKVSAGWKGRPDYSWDAGGNADHCYLAALALTANHAFADDELVEKTESSVLQIYTSNDRRWPKLRTVRDREEKVALLTEFLRDGPRSRIDDLFVSNDFETTCRLLIPDFDEINRELMAYVAKHPDILQDLHWRKFEKLLDAIFKNQGYYTELGPGSGDGGVDLRLIQKDTIGTILTLVQAKRYKETNAIDLQGVQALHGVVTDQNAHRGLFVTTSRYLPSAEKFAERQNDRLVLATSKDVAKWCQSIVGE